MVPGDHGAQISGANVEPIPAGSNAADTEDSESWCPHESAEETGADEVRRSEELNDLRRRPTLYLQNLLGKQRPAVGTDSYGMPRGDSAKRMARSILESRMSRQRNYLIELRQLCAQLREGAWREIVAPLGSANELYENWLNAGDSSAKLPPGLEPTWNLTLSRGGSKKGESRYHVYTDEPENLLGRSGALITSALSLQMICESGHQLAIEPTFWLEFMFDDGPFRRVVEVGREYRDGPRSHAEGAVVNAWRTNKSVCLYLQEAGSYASDVPPAARVRISCLQIGPLMFMVLLKLHTKMIPYNPSTLPNAVPCWPLGGGKYFRILDLQFEVRIFFNDSWNTRRLAQLLAHQRLQSRQNWAILLWLLSVWWHARRIELLASHVEEMNYASVSLSMRDALRDIKDQRSHVAFFLQNIKSTWDAIDKLSLRAAYTSTTVEGEEINADSEEAFGSRLALTPRQFAATSPQAEYDWLVKQATDLMLSLNDDLQLVIAMINVEQSDIVLRETELSRQNGTRSTQLTLLAAIYLPLTLATGIFGMNIKDVNADTVRFWWPIIIAAVLVVPSAVIILYIFWRSRANRKIEKARHDNSRDYT